MDYKKRFIEMGKLDLSVHDFVHQNAVKGGEFISGDLVTSDIKACKKEWKEAIKIKKEGKKLPIELTAYDKLVKDIEVIDVYKT